VNTHLSGHEGCMSLFVNHIDDMQGFLFAMVSVFVFSIFLIFVFVGDLFNLNISNKYFLYIKKVILLDKTKTNWLAILFHAPPCFR
jgi:hypothetical protein